MTRASPTPWKRSSRAALFGALALALAVAGCKQKPDAGQAGKGGPGGPGGAGREGRVIPVVAEKVARRDVPIYLEGLGNAVAYKTVTVRPLVDGRLESVSFREGQEVRRGEVLAQIDPRPFQNQVHQAEGALARDLALLRGSEKNLQRYSALTEKKLIAPQQAEDQAASVGQTEGAVRIDRAQLDAAKLNLDYARITAPIDGVTGVRLIDPGNVVRASDPTGLVIVTQLDPIAVLFTLPEDELPRVMQELRKGPLLVDAFSRDGETLLGTGQVLLVDNQINQATATMRVKAVFKNPQRLLWPNLFVKARLLLSVRHGAIVVPSTVVQRGPEGTYAYVVGPDQTVSPKPVVAGPQLGDTTIVEDGLQPGDLVVVDGQNQLRPGAKVAPRTPGQDSSPPAAAKGGRARGAGGAAQ